MGGADGRDALGTCKRATIGRWRCELEPAEQRCAVRGIGHGGAVPVHEQARDSDLAPLGRGLRGTRAQPNRL